MKKVALLFFSITLSQASFSQTSIRTIHSAIGKITHCEFSPDGTMAVACSQATEFYGQKIASLTVFNTVEEKLIKEFPVAAIFATFSPDNSKLVYWDYSNGLVIRNLATDETKSIIENKKENIVYAAKYSRDGKLIALGCFDSSIKIIDASTFNIIRTLQSNDKKGMCFKLDFMSNGTLVSMGNGIAKVWDVQTGKELRKQGRSTSSVQLGFATEANKVLLSYLDSTFVMETNTGKITAKNNFANFANAAFSPKGNLYLLCDSQGIYAFNGDGTFGEQNGAAFPETYWMDIDRKESKVIVATEVNVLMVDFSYFKEIANRK